jgi:hypothetical protein
MLRASPTRNKRAMDGLITKDDIASPAEFLERRRLHSKCLTMNLVGIEFNPLTYIDQEADSAYN